jgi:3-oxoacyl-[acyl-carrier-protein] synthase-3
MLYLNTIGTFVPENRVPVRALRDKLGLTSSKMRYYEKFLGFRSIAVAPSDDVAEMLVPAGAEALRGVRRDAVRYLIYAHTAHHVAPPSRRTVDRVRETLGLTNATAFALSHLNCAGALYAVQLAGYLLDREDPAALALVVTGERAPSSWLQLLPGTAIMGEAAAGFLVGRQAVGDHVLGFAVRILGRFYAAGDCSAELRLDYDRVYADTIGSVMHEAMRKAGVTADELTVVLPNNVNRYSWGSVARATGIPLDRFYLDCIAELGHCFGADPFINLARSKAQGRVKPGDLVLMVTSGLGAIFSALVARVGDGTPL